MERKAAIVRFWFVVMLVAILGIIEPACWFGFAPLFLFSAGCACADCASGGAPAQFQVVIANIQNGTCRFCTMLNGTYVLDCYTGGSGADCRWLYTLPAQICTADYLEMEITSTLLHVEFSDSGSPHSATSTSELGWTEPRTTGDSCALSGFAVRRKLGTLSSNCSNNFLTTCEVSAV